MVTGAGDDGMGSEDIERSEVEPQRPIRPDRHGERAASPLPEDPQPFSIHLEQRPDRRGSRGERGPPAREREDWRWAAWSLWNRAPGVGRDPTRGPGDDEAEMWASSASMV